jgi:hypothetical protein
MQPREFARKVRVCLIDEKGVEFVADLDESSAEKKVFGGDLLVTWSSKVQR